MNLLALLIGIFFERSATRLFHLRAPRFAQKYMPAMLRIIGKNKLVNIALVALLLILSVLPVLFIDRLLVSQGYVLLHFLFAIIVLFFSFGPHDLVSDVGVYQQALQGSGESAETEMQLIEAAMPLTELRQHSHLDACSLTVTEGILAQGNKRFFAVIFWFLILGPTGAALFRITNSWRRESFRCANSELATDTQAASALNKILRQWQGLLGWIPARLTALSYVLAGHFDSGIQALRTVQSSEDADMYAKNQDVMMQTGTASLQTPNAESLADPELARVCTSDALRLVKRSLGLWTVIIAILTLWGTVH